MPSKVGLSDHSLGEHPECIFIADLESCRLIYGGALVLRIQRRECYGTQGDLGIVDFPRNLRKSIRQMRLVKIELRQR